MLIDTLHLTPAGPGRVRVTWPTSHSAWPAWLFIDGRLAAGPIVDAAGLTERSVSIGWLEGETHVVEVHELPSLDIVAASIYPEPTTSPGVSWNSRPEAERYRRYHRETPDGEDTLVYDGPAVPDEFGLCHFKRLTLDGRGGRWHFFRVEAVDIYGHESARLSWVYRAVEPPDAPSLTIVAGSTTGRYTLTLLD